MERIYEKYGWLIFIALGLLWLVTGLSQVFNADVMIEMDVQRVTGMSLSELEALNPESIELVRLYMGTMGNLKISWSFLLLAITLTGYRKGEKWAWYALWLAPAILISQGIIDTIILADINEMVKWIPITSLSLLGLLIPIRKFFPKKPGSEKV
jgi:hypothetical protein